MKEIFMKTRIVSGMRIIGPNRNWIVYQDIGRGEKGVKDRQLVPFNLVGAKCFLNSMIELIFASSGEAPLLEVGTPTNASYLVYKAYGASAVRRVVLSFWLYESSSWLGDLVDKEESTRRFRLPWRGQHGTIIKSQPVDEGTADIWTSPIRLSETGQKRVWTALIFDDQLPRITPLKSPPLCKQG